MSDQRLEEATRKLPARSPPAGWEDNVLAAIERPAPRRAWIWVPFGVAAAAAVALWMAWPHPPDELALVTRVVPGPAAVRGDEAKAGDTWVLEATVGAAAQSDVRVYRSDRLVASCDDGTCRREGGRLMLSVELEWAGSYRAVVLAGATVPPSTGELDQDVAAARSGGAQAIVSPALVVARFSPKVTL